MTEFRVGDKVRVLECAEVDLVAGRLPYESQILEHYPPGSTGWLVLSQEAGLGWTHQGDWVWYVSPENLELIESTPPSPPLYEGWEDDVRLLAFLNDSRAGTAAGDAARRLEAAFLKPRCEKQLWRLALDQQWRLFDPPVRCAREAHGDEEECEMKMEGLEWR